MFARESGRTPGPFDHRPGSGFDPGLDIGQHGAEVFVLVLAVVFHVDAVIDEVFFETPLLACLRAMSMRRA